ncbi:hypothetical protein [uncultured Gammaproteobacteria bacterium]|nr:hypothetical protein [uncultured Gammaproteobacteria bacterium]
MVANTNTNTNDNDNTNDNRAGHYGEDNNIYLNDTNINNTKDLTTTIGHETSHALDNQDPSINTNPQNNASKTDNEIYADNYGDDFGDYVEFASENYGNGNLASTNNRNLGNTPAETQRNTKLVERNNQDYARIDKSKGEDRQVISIRGGDINKAVEIGINKSGLNFTGQNLEEYQAYYQSKLYNYAIELKKKLKETNYTKEQKEDIFQEQLNKAADFYNKEEFKSSLITLPNEILKLDSKTKVKIFDSGQKNTIVESIIKDYKKGEQIILQGHSAGAGDVQDITQVLKDKKIANIITVQIDSIEPFGNDASIPSNVNKAINVYQSESKTGNSIIDFMDSNAMNGEDNIEPDLFNNRTEIVNQEFVNIQGPSTGKSSDSHRNMDNDPKVQEFIQDQVLPEVEKDINRE